MDSNAVTQATISDTQLTPLVQIKPGHKNPPIFIAHGIGGSAEQLRPLAAHIDVLHPIYATQFRGADDEEEPHETIQDTAQYHLAAIRHLQPHGPYFLIGFSLGGLVMLEIATQLLRDTEKVALLMMLDSYPHATQLSAAQRTHLVAKRAVRATKRILKPDPKIPSDRKPPLSQVLLRAKQAAETAWLRYNPQFYAGKVHFLRAEKVSSFPANPDLIWRRLVSEFDMQTVPGDHVGMITTFAKETGGVVTTRLHEALSKQMNEASHQ